MVILNGQWIHRPYHKVRVLRVIQILIIEAILIPPGICGDQSELLLEPQKKEKPIFAEIVLMMVGMEFLYFTQMEK